LPPSSTCRCASSHGAQAGAPEPLSTAH
jgi:hypothetical protein